MELDVWSGRDMLYKEHITMGEFAVNTETTVDQWVLRARRHVSKIVGEEVRAMCENENLRTTVWNILSRVELMVSNEALLALKGSIPVGLRAEKYDMINFVAHACGETLTFYSDRQDNAFYPRIVVAKICEILWRQNRMTLAFVGSPEKAHTPGVLLTLSKGECL